MDDDRTIGWWVLGAFLLAAAGGAWVWWRTPAPAEPAASQAAPAEQPAAAQPDPQAAEHPIEAAPAALAAMAETAPLPALAESDSALRTAIAGLVGEGALLEFFHMTGIATRIVATVDNLPRGKVATKILPVRGPGGAFIVDGEAGARVIGAANAGRYAAHLRLAEAVDSRRAAALYVRFYPLLQQAYRDLGYPQGNFNDRLVAVIDHLLATPAIDGPISLVQPGVLYEFADPSLEARSAGQKLLLRMGPANAARYAAHLRLVEAIDARRAAALYVRFYPLLQQAYRELGFPQGHFNDRVVAVIDHLLATPTIEGPIALVQPKVLYEFTDPDLEARSAGQKLLLRMGTANAARVRTRLLEFRRQITAAPPPR